MGLYADLTNDIGEAFDTDLSDAVSSVTYQHIEKTFDNITNVSTETITTFNSRGVASYYKSQEIGASQGSILGTDRSFIMLQTDLGTQPIIDDLIILEGLTHKIMDVSKDPANSTWTLQLRGAVNG